MSENIIEGTKLVKSAYPDNIVRRNLSVGFLHALGGKDNSYGAYDPSEYRMSAYGLYGERSGGTISWQPDGIFGPPIDYARGLGIGGEGRDLNLGSAANYNDSISGSALGAIIGFISATGFALYSVTIRWKPETPKFTTVFLAGLFCAFFSFCVLGLSFQPFADMPVINSYLSLLHGLIVASGLILYTLGAKHLPSAELTLLSLMEVVGGVLWVWIPFFGINEQPSFTVIFQ